MTGVTAVTQVTAVAGVTEVTPVTAVMGVTAATPVTAVIAIASSPGSLGEKKEPGDEAMIASA